MTSKIYDYTIRGLLATIREKMVVFNYEDEYVINQIKEYFKIIEDLQEFWNNNNKWTNFELQMNYKNTKDQFNNYCNGIF